MIHYTLDVLGSFIGPLFGVLIVDFYLVKHGKIVVDDLFTMSKTGRYWYTKGVNRRAVLALLPAAVIAVALGDDPLARRAAELLVVIGAAFPRSSTGSWRTRLHTPERGK